MPHQKEGVDWLCTNKKGLLWIPAGAGKTLTTLEALKTMGCKNILVVAPVSLLSVWRDEVQKFYGEEVTIIRGDKKKREELWKKDGMRVVGYEALRMDWKIAYGRSWDAIVLDESYKIMNPRAKVTKVVLALHAPVQVALNGTAISNSYADLWAVCHWLAPGSLYKNFWAFRAQHAIMNPHFPAIVGWRGKEEIERRTAPLIFRKRKEEVLAHLPPMTEQTVRFPMNAEERRVYKEIKEELVVRLAEKEMPVVNALVELMRLRQVTNGLYAFGSEDESSKIAALKDLLGSFGGDEKVIIFSSFKTTVDKIRDEMGGFVITGDTPGEVRELVIKQFNEAGGACTLAMTAAGERGLNLQAASVIVHMDLPWSYAAYDQRNGRAWRTGQTKPVHVYVMEAEGTVDEKVAKILARKMVISEEFGGGITREDIKDLLT